MNSPSGSLLTIVMNYSHTCACAAYTSHGYYSRAAFISLRASTIRGQRLFEEIRYVICKHVLVDMIGTHCSCVTCT